MDSWFTMPPLVKAIVEQGLDVIGMVKETKQRYSVNGKLVSFKATLSLSATRSIEKRYPSLHSLRDGERNTCKNCIHSK